MISRTLGTAVLACLACPPVSLAQEAATLVDAPLVVVNQTQRMNALLDLDGDGYQDAAGFWYGAQDGTTEVTGFRNQHDGSFVQKWKLTLTYTHFNGYKEALIPARVDGNSPEDFVLSLHDRVRVYLSSMTGAPTLLQDWTEADQVDSMVALDFDNDGFSDLAVLTEAALRIYHNDQGTGFTPVASASAAGIELTATEVNGDGSPDVLDIEGNDVRLFPIVGGQLLPDQRYQHGIDDPMPASGDIDGDGDEDIVVFGMTSYRVLRRVGPTTFTLEPIVSGGPATNFA